MATCEGKCFGKFDGALNLLAAQYAAPAIPELSCSILSAIVYNAEGSSNPDSPVKGWVRSHPRCIFNNYVLHASHRGTCITVIHVDVPRVSLHQCDMTAAAVRSVAYAHVLSTAHGKPLVNECV